MVKKVLQIIRSIFRPFEVTVAQEREFERANIMKKRESYLKSNSLDRYENDPVYRAKVDQLASGLKKFVEPSSPRWILDLGGSTGGEATVLLEKGFPMILSDINEVALDVARARARQFGLQVPHCIAADVHALPFSSGSFQVVMVIEALHHFQDYDQALSEIYRVLEPGGGLMALEPNGWNPFRRMSEIRDRFRGTIEKSFTKRQLTRLLQRAGFESIEIESVRGGRSAMRMNDVPAYRRPFARLHAWLQRNYPRFFGAYQIWASKSGEGSPQEKPWPEFLEVPGGGESVVLADGIWRAGGDCFPDFNGVPVLISSDRNAEELTMRGKSKA